MASQTRDKILKEGAVRYRHSAISLQKWRPRHLVFKVTHAGRLQLIVYKESPPTAANEIKEIAIDEFGGLESNLKLDSEKYVFAIITTHMTECFSTETPQQLTEWKHLLQEYLGKELVVSINVPVKQHFLKAGKGSLRIRNTGFTITTCDNPPRCQGTWHIIHIRKYGGTDLFRFQTGSKCPTGEYLYSIETQDNAGIKKLFNDLSNHRPIFADDRLGRRMTLERPFHRYIPNATKTPSRTGNNRLSLQSGDRNSEKHLYENREQAMMIGRHSSSDLSVPYSSPRRASFDDGVFMPGRVDGSSNIRQVTPLRKIPNAEDDMLYQNIQPGKNVHPSRASPTKKSHLSPISVPVPEGYYTVTPPPLVRHHHSSNASPSSSPEESIFQDQLSYLMAQSNQASETFPDPNNIYANANQELSRAIVGDNVIVNKASRRSKALSPPSETPEIGGMYQNLDFMRGTGAEQGSKRSTVEQSSSEATIPATISEEPWSPHNYTNVDFAHANAQGHATKNIRPRKSRMTSPLHTVKPATRGKVERKISMPVKSTSRDSPRKKLIVSTSSDDLLSPSSDSIDSSSTLRNSLSNYELNSDGKDKSLDYYNFCAPKLPAHSSPNKALSLRNKLTLSGHKLPHSNDALYDNNMSETMSPDDSDINDYSKLSAVRNGTDAYTGKLKRRSSSCDCLDLHESAVEHLEPLRPESHNAMYDKLIPLANAAIYDSLRPSKEDLKSGSSSPDAVDSPAETINLTHDQKISYMKRSHKYEYIDVDLENRGSEKSGSNSPVGMEHPSDWTSSLPVSLLSSHEAKKSVSGKETKTLPRRKQLPLQESTDREQSSTEAEYSTVTKARPPRLARDNNSVESTDSQVRHTSLTVNPHRKSQARSSADSMELLSSIESAPESRRASVFSNGSTSSAEIELKHNRDHVKREHSNSPIHRVTREEVEIKSKPSQTSTDTQEPPPLPKRDMPSTSSSRDKSSPPVPPRPQEPRFTVPLPQAQFDFVRSPPLPRPKVLCPSDLSYAAVTFANGEKPIYSQVEPIVRSNRPSMKISQIPGDVSYAAVDFEMTAGLQRTSEQVADHHREFFEFKQQS